MNKEMIEGLYFAAVEYCEIEARNEAWLFEHKFAELIIKECAAVADKHWLESSHPPGISIKEHFGVQE